MSKYFSVIPESLVGKLREALTMTDGVAFKNVTHDNDGASILDSSGVPIKGRFPRGGPFGAALAVSYNDTLELVGEARGNNVVGSGIASTHAEDQALMPDNYGALISRLVTLKSEGHGPMVWMISSGQSCTTCHTKQEIMARDLIAHGLIDVGHFATLYGATYDDTFRIARFYDAQYADAMILNARAPRNAGNLIKSHIVPFAQTPWQVQDILQNAVAPTAVVMRNNEAYVTGVDSRDKYSLFATVEVMAVRNACTRYRRDEKAFAAWEIDGTLYTTTSEMGPLLFAEMGWTRIKNRVHVVMPPMLAHQQFESRETPKLGNRAFLKVVAGGYDDNAAAIAVFRDEFHNGRAQPMWARVLQTNPEMLYNGDSVSDVVLQERDLHTRYRFAGKELLCACGGAPHQPQPLAMLRDFMPSDIK